MNADLPPDSAKHSKGSSEARVVRCRRIWSEHLPYGQLRRPALLEGLASREIQLIVAVQPAHLDELPGLLGECRGRGVAVGLWPLVEDRDGRWPSDQNVEVFGEHLRRVLDRPGLGGGELEVVFDLEPPIALARRWLSLRPWGGPVRLRPSNLEGAAEHFESLIQLVRQAGALPTAVIPPMILCDPAGVRGGWQRLLGTPVEGLGFARISVMAYTSLFEGYSRGLFTRPHARAMLGALALMARRRWGGRAALALGVAGGGALGDERRYRGLAELRDDVAVARAAGIDDLALFALEGVLDRRDPQRWLDGFVEATPPALSPRLTGRTRAALFLGAGVGHLFDHLSDVLPLAPR